MAAASPVPTLAALGLTLQPGDVLKQCYEAWAYLKTGKGEFAKLVVAPNPADIAKNPDYAAKMQDLGTERLGWKQSALIGMNDEYSLAKVIGANNLNRQMDLPRSVSTNTLSDKFTMQPLFIVDGTDISAARTGANAAKVVDHFLSDKSDIWVFIHGSGPVARWCIRILNHHAADRIRGIAVRSPRNAGKLVDELSGEVSIPLRVADDNSLMKHSQLIITATTSDVPLYTLDDLPADPVVLHLSGDEAPKAFIDLAVAEGSVFCDSIKEVSRRNSQSLALAFSRSGQKLEDAGRRLGVRELAELDGPVVRKPGKPVLVTCVGLGIFDLFVTQSVYGKYVATKK
jgi:alanine dehydrogenase